MVIIYKYTRLCIKRAIAFIIDWILIFIIGTGLLFIGPRFDMKYLLVPSTKMFSSYGVILGILSFIALPLLKDLLFKNASLGKAIMRIVVVDTDSLKYPSVLHMILRNITFYLAPIEAIAFFVNKGKTIGDSISNTVVVGKSEIKDRKSQ